MLTLLPHLTKWIEQAPEVNNITVAVAAPMEHKGLNFEKLETLILKTRIWLEYKLII